MPGEIQVSKFDIPYDNGDGLWNVSLFVYVAESYVVVLVMRRPNRSEALVLLSCCSLSKLRRFARPQVRFQDGFWYILVWWLRGQSAIT